MSTSGITLTRAGGAHSRHCGLRVRRWGDAPDRGGEANLVVVRPDAVQFGNEFGVVADLLEMGPFALDGSEQRFDPGLVFRHAGPNWRAIAIPARNSLVLTEVICGP